MNKSRNLRERLVREESGFTLPEMLVTIMIMIVVLFALYSIFDMSMRVFAFGNDEVEAVENARLGLERMEREIRAAYPVDRSESDQRYLFFNADGSTGPPGDPPPKAMPSATRITFGNELGATGDGRITCGDPCEYITYKLDGSTLSRVNAPNSTDAGEPVVEFVEPNGLKFTYYCKTDCDDADPGVLNSVDNSLTNSGLGDIKNMKFIHTVRIELDIRVEGGEQDGTQTLATDVDLRNQGSVALAPLPSLPPPPPPPPPSNQPPTARNDGATVQKNRSVTINALGNDTDPDGDSLTVSRVYWTQDDRSERGGTVRKNANGTITFSSKNGFEGIDRFRYDVSDGKGGTATATVWIWVGDSDDDDDDD